MTRVSDDRRLFLKYLGAGMVGSMAGGVSPLGPLVEAQGRMPFQAVAATEFLSFPPIQPTDQDELVLPRGFRYQTVIAYGDRFTTAGERFGFNADFTAFFPRNADGTEGLLWVNHEYATMSDPNYPQAFTAAVGGVATVQDQKNDVGASVVHISRTPAGNWLVAPRSALNRRITADSLAIAEYVDKTLAICVRCGAPANRTQRLGGQTDRVVVGGADEYEARCRRCFQPGGVRSET